MKLRSAMKVRKSIGTKREPRYKQSTLRRALDRYEKTKSAKSAEKFFFDMLDWMGPAGRARVIAKHDPAGALDLLMRTPESKWGRF